MSRSIAVVTLVAFAFAVPAAAGAQSTTQTKVTTDHGIKDGMPTTTKKVVHVRKHKTHRPKKVLGVTVGHKTVTHKTVRETTTDADGDKSTMVKKSN